MVAQFLSRNILVRPVLGTVDLYLPAAVLRLGMWKVLRYCAVNMETILVKRGLWAPEPEHWLSENWK